MSRHLVLRAPGRHGHRGRVLAMGDWGQSGGVWLIWQRPVRVLRSWSEVLDLVAEIGGAARVEVVFGSLARRPDEPSEHREDGECTTLPGRRAVKSTAPGKHRPPRVGVRWRRYVVACALLFAFVMLLVPLSCSPASAASVTEPAASSPEIPSALAARLAGETTRWQEMRANRSRLIDRANDQAPAVRTAGLPCAAAGRLVRPPAAALRPNGAQNRAWA